MSAIVIQHDDLHQWISTGGPQAKFSPQNHKIRPETGFQYCDDQRENIYFYFILFKSTAAKVSVQKNSDPHRNIVGDPWPTQQSFATDVLSDM